MIGRAIGLGMMLLALSLSVLFLMFTVIEQDESKTSKAGDGQQTAFEGRGGSGKPMAQQRQQKGNKATDADSKAASLNNGSSSGTRNEEAQTKFEDKKGVREDMGQQRQRQGQRAKQQGENTTKNEAKPPPSDKSGSQQGQQAQNGGNETSKDNNKPPSSNDDSGSKGAKDHDTKSCAPSRGGVPIPI